MNALSRDEEVALARRAASGDKGAEDELIVRNLPLVKHFAARFRGNGVEREDLIQEGSVALVTAVRSFDPKRNVRLSTYVGLSIFRRMSRTIERHRRSAGRIAAVDVDTLPARPDEVPLIVRLTGALDQAIDEVLSRDEGWILRLEIRGVSIRAAARKSGRSRRDVGRVRRRAIAKLRNRLAPAA